MVLLSSKHPEPQYSDPDSIVDMQSSKVHHIGFDSIAGESRRIAALNIQQWMLIVGDIYWY